jgi:hypothetical protein
VDARKQLNCPPETSAAVEFINVGNIETCNLPQAGVLVFEFLLPVVVKTFRKRFAYIYKSGCFQGKAVQPVGVTGKAFFRYNKTKEDEKWDGLKGYMTNTELPAAEICKQYSELWQVERVFRVTKGVLELRPMFHFLTKIWGKIGEVSHSQSQE